MILGFGELAAGFLAECKACSALSLSSCSMPRLIYSSVMSELVDMLSDIFCYKGEQWFGIVGLGSGIVLRVEEV